jgi:hypothetical protein
MMPTINLDIASNIITTLDNLFIDLVRRFTNQGIVESPANLQASVAESRKHLLPTRPNATGRVQP